MSNYLIVYKVKFTLAVQDPDVEGERQHTTLFVATSEESSGDLFHVTGDITSAGGMIYERKKRDDPRLSQSFHSKTAIGITTPANYPQSWDTILQTWTPPQQKAFNMKTMRTEPFKTLNPLVFYEPGEPRKQLIKCTEWTEQFAIPTLTEKGLIQPLTAAE
jgi:hypothetical protein